MTTHIQGHATIQEQQELGNHADMHERHRVDLLLDGVRNQWLGGVKSNILCQPQLYNDFNATANHLKDCFNPMSELQASGRQLSAVGGRGRGCNGHGYGNDRGCRRGGRGRDRRAHNPNPTKVTHNADLLPDQAAVDNVKASIAHKYIIRNKIFVNKGMHREMSKPERHAVFQIRDALDRGKTRLLALTMGGTLSLLQCTALCKS